MMEVQELTLPGLLLLKPRVFTDARGSFMEPFNARQFAEATAQSTAQDDGLFDLHDIRTARLPSRDGSV